MAEQFVHLLKKLLVSAEFGHTEEEADRLIKAYPQIVSAFEKKGNFFLRAAATALEMKDE